MMNRLKFVFIVLLLMGGIYIQAQNRSYKAERINGTTPRIDGVFDDKIWQNNDWEGDFTQFEPNNGEKPSQRTFFKIVYDEDNLYVAFRALDSVPDKIERRMSRRDGWEGDIIGVQIDSYNDKRTAFIFAVNAAGVKNDGIMTDDGDNFDDSWDPIWMTKTTITNEGWNAEFKIPLSQFRFSQKEKQSWGLQIGRLYFRKSEFIVWKHVPENESGWISHFGTLEGLNNLKPKRQIELAPFALLKFDNYEKEEGNPYANGQDFSFNYGIDGKIGVTNNMILDFTINPDFGQVEADPSEVNLSAFESYFSEKRPFFIEGKNITDYQITPGGSPWSQDNIFYSRRIGRRPHGDPELNDDEYADIPENTKIIGAFKLTGKTNNGWSIGVIESMAAKEEAEIDLNGEKRKEVVEPFTNYLIARVQKDINKGNTIIGGIFTSTNRNIEDTGIDYLNDKAITGGIDFRQYFKEKKYFLTTSFVASKISGSENAIVEQQYSSRRYYQRPGARYLGIDSSLTSLSGYGGNFGFGKQANSGFRFAFNATWRSPGLELNDVGYSRNSDIIFQYLWGGYSYTKPFSIFRRLNVNMNQWAGWDFGGVNIFNGGNVNYWIQFKNLWTFQGGADIEFKEVSNTMLRGGPAMKLPGGKNFWIGLGTNGTKKVAVNTSFMRSKGDKKRHENKRFSGSVSYRPINNLSISLNPSYSEYNTELQYIDEFNVANEPRYLFAEMNQKTFVLTARVDFNVSPDLTIQYYASPFISAGRFSDYKKITNPDADNYFNRFASIQNNIEYINTDNVYQVNESGSALYDYSFENPDFNFKQMRSNLVVRWEYVPGSLLYLVWSQGLTGSDEYGTFNYFDDMGDLFNLVAHNTFLVKISHRFRVGKWL